MPAMKGELAMKDVDGLVLLVRGFPGGKLRFRRIQAPGGKDDPEKAPPPPRSPDLVSAQPPVSPSSGSPGASSISAVWPSHSRSDHLPKALRRLSRSEWKRIPAASQHPRHTRFHPARLAREARRRCLDNLDTRGQRPRHAPVRLSWMRPAPMSP